MKSNTTCCRLILLLSYFLTLVFAYGQRGSAERVLYYYAYLADEITHQLNGKNYEVGYGCVGSRKGGRCTLEEFLQYIWEPTPDTEQEESWRPKVVLPKVDQFFDLDIDRQINEINRWFDKEQKKQHNRRVSLSGASNSQKLYPGAADYYDALSKVGEAIGHCRAAVDDEVSKMKPDDDRLKKGGVVDGWKSIITRGKTAAEAVVNWRLSDLESFRIKELNKRLQDKFTAASITEQAEWELVQGRRTPKMFPGYETIDTAATIDKYKHIQDIDTMVNNCLSEYHNRPNTQAQKHYTALEAARQSERACGCT